MAETPTHILRLKELYDLYKGQEVADAVGVSIRQVQNYLRKDNPAIPSKEVINNIHEAFANHKKGIKLQPVVADSNYKDKYIASLERENARLQKDLDLSLGEVRHNLLLSRAIAETNQELLIELLAKQRKTSVEEVALEVSKANGERYQKMK